MMSKDAVKITRVKYYDLGKHKRDSFLGRCSVVIGDVLMLNEILILSGNGGDYIVMPSRETNTGGMNNHTEDVFHPVDRNYFSYMVETILEGYRICRDTGKCVYRPE